MTPDWEALVRQAREGDCEPLAYALRPLMARAQVKGRRLRWDEIPAPVREFLVEQATPTRRRRGRPAYSGWYRAITRLTYNDLRVVIGAFKDGGERLTLKDKYGNELVVSPTDVDTPSEIVLRYLAQQDDKSAETLRDIVYGRRRKRRE